MMTFDAAAFKASLPSLDVRLHVPRHIALVMDGNGRWADRQGVERHNGHAAGAEALRRLLYVAEKWGIDYMTVYAFSTENWGRDPEEVKALMDLMAFHLSYSLPDLLASETRLVVLGDLSRLDPELRHKLEETQILTAQKSTHTLNVAISYGGRDEIFQAALKLYHRLEAEGLDPNTLTPNDLAAHLYTQGQPDPDLIIRTSGEHRLSNFMLWQSAYSEFYVTPTLWPDFTHEDLARAIGDYNQRQRRFGGRVDSNDEGSFI